MSQDRPGVKKVQKASRSSETRKATWVSDFESDAGVVRAATNAAHREEALERMNVLLMAHCISAAMAWDLTEGKLAAVAKRVEDVPQWLFDLADEVHVTDYDGGDDGRL